MSKFYQEDLPYGEAGEKFVLGIINRKHSMAYKMEGYFVEYDIMIPEIDKTVEVKRDKHTDRTGNAFIETYCNKIKSGINVSTADYWAYLTKTMLYWIKSNELKICISENNIPEGKNYKIDGKIIDAYLIPIDIFKNYCMRIDTLTEEQLCQLN
jgi:hypothetical protein